MEDRFVKQILVIRKDIGKKCRKGKLMAQASHASVAALLMGMGRDKFDVEPKDIVLQAEKNSPIERWLNSAFTKITLSVDTDDELVKLYEKIKEENPLIPCALITDNGKTEFHGIPTNTCLGIGPWWADEIDIFTAKLPLF